MLYIHFETNFRHYTNHFHTYTTTVFFFNIILNPTYYIQGSTTTIFLINTFFTKFSLHQKSHWTNCAYNPFEKQDKQPLFTLTTDGHRKTHHTYIPNTHTNQPQVGGVNQSWPRAHVPCRPLVSNGALGEETPLPLFALMLAYDLWRESLLGIRVGVAFFRRFVLAHMRDDSSVGGWFIERHIGIAAVK